MIYDTVGHRPLHNLLLLLTVRATFVLLVLLGVSARAQELSQTVKGRVSDRLSSSPLDGATVRLIGTTELTATTDSSGFFLLQAPVGRYKLSVSFTGYAPWHDELLVIAGKHTTANVTLETSETMLTAVEVQSVVTVDEFPGLQSLSVEKTLRVPANFFDPVRVATAYPGVVAVNDQANGIIVRGNSPTGLLWRLNGLDIVNPNHLSNAGTISDRPVANGGGVNILSAQMLDRTDFYMGYVPASYGNTLAGVIDMKMREGNKTEWQHTLQASLIGIDLATEGPIGKSGRNSIAANYRYSTVGLLSMIGVNFGDEEITFQDFSLSADFEGKAGKLTLFGFAGISGNDFAKDDSSTWEEDKDRYVIGYQGTTYSLGFNYSKSLGTGKLIAGAAFSSADQVRDATSQILNRPTERMIMMDRYNAANSILSSTLRYEARFGSRITFDGGIMLNDLNSSLDMRVERGCQICSFREVRVVEGKTSGALIQPFTNFKFKISEPLTISAGARYLYYSYNDSKSLEPRLAIALTPGRNSGVDFTYALTSQVQQTIAYVSNGSGRPLGFTKSHHFDASYWQHLTDRLKIKTGVFYQSLFDVPVDTWEISSNFSMINYTEGFVPPNLMNKGTGENYGVDVTLEKYFFASTYMLLSASYYEAKYTGNDGVERDSRFNGNYTFSSVYGKEWTKKEKNRTIALNLRMLYLGGMRETPINPSASWAQGETAYVTYEPYANKLEDYFRIDARLSFRKNKPNYTRTFAVDIQNLTSQKNVAYHYYDAYQEAVLTKFQLGIIPVLVYRIDF
jgi:hypothetical protein